MREYLNHDLTIYIYIYIYLYLSISIYIYLYLAKPVFGLRLVGGGGARQGAKISKIGAQI